MSKKLLSLFLYCIISLFAFHVDAKNNYYAEIFDPKQNKVVKSVQISPDIHNIVVDWIVNIDGMNGKLDPFTDDGYVVRFPLDPAVSVQSKWIKAVVSEVYIIIPEEDSPFYFICEDDNKASCFQFNGDVNILSQFLNFKLHDIP